MNIDTQNKIIAELSKELQIQLKDLSVHNLKDRLSIMKAAIRMLEEIPNLSDAHHQIVDGTDHDYSTVDQLNLSDIPSDCPDSREDTTNETIPLKPLAIQSDLGEDQGELLIREIQGAKADDKYISEKLIRVLNLEHHDIVKVTSNNDNFHVKLIKKGPGIPRADRVEFKFCYVEEEKGVLLIRHHREGFDLVPLPIGEFVISEDEIRKKEIRPGDIVDLAYLEQQPHYIQVIWKHATDVIPQTPPLPASSYKRSSLPTATERILPEYYKELRDKTVLVVGGDDRHADYRDAFASQGANFIGLKGDSTPDKVRTQVAKADVVVIVICAIRTRTGEFTPNICKNLKVPFTRVHKDGLGSILRAAAIPKSEGV
ncbi:hypothetical protein POF51_25755 [Brevibacillus sp. AG]|uniref:hypothetical protein n=1 Tax=Brevibacillus sp. AG TaxID=3020891 RepID=UPI0023311BF2|nr:hypothetical protein [Brevibacillus sp. AG]MDC0764128.1 hypothetical protein [Brevibacillus sp. AG]